MVVIEIISDCIANDDITIKRKLRSLGSIFQLPKIGAKSSIDKSVAIELLNVKFRQ
jgi:hypothetical protein